jgi:hypothetical protein
VSVRERIYPSETDDRTNCGDGHLIFELYASETQSYNIDRQETDRQLAGNKPANKNRHKAYRRPKEAILQQTPSIEEGAHVRERKAAECFPDS